MICMCVVLLLVVLLLRQDAVELRNSLSMKMLSVRQDEL